MKLKALSVVAATLFAAGAANAATNLVTNGGFETLTGAPVAGQSYEFGDSVTTGIGPAGWTSTSVGTCTVAANCPTGKNGFNIVFATSTATSSNGALTTSRFPTENQHLDALPANANGLGNYVVALDGDQGSGSVPGAQATLSQVITGLVVGQVYNLNFDWAGDQLQNRTGNTSEQLKVTLGGSSQLTSTLNDLSGQATPWAHSLMFFTATSTTETLSFLSMGTPTGFPPVALLDNVSLAIPEPTSWALMIIGFGGVGAAMRSSRRRRAMVAA